MERESTLWLVLSHESQALRGDVLFMTKTLRGCEALRLSSLRSDKALFLERQG